MKYYIAILIAAISVKSYAQIQFDTIQFKEIKTKTIDSFESLGMKILDTINKPKAYILTKNEKPETIAIKKGRKHIVFDLLPNSDYGYVTNIERIEVNGKNHKELVVYCTNINGRSGMRGGFREEFKRIIVYDIKKMMLLFDSDYYFSSHNWNYNISEDEEGTTTSEYKECDNFDIRFGKKEIIMELKTSKDCDSINFLDYDITKWNYKLRKKSFIGKGVKDTKKTQDNQLKLY